MTNLRNTLVSATAALMLAGCNQVAMPDLMPTGAVFGAAQAPAFEHTIAEKRPTQEAFLRVPAGAGNILDVTQKRYGNGAEQLIVYRGDHHTRGENAARVKLVSAASRFGRRPEDLKIEDATDTKIRNELRQVLPGVSMSISNQLHTNAYGPFGYALGKAGSGVRCIYGWQNMSGTESDRWAPLRGQSAKPRLSIRLRVCRGDASSEQLVDLMRNLRIDADPDQVLKPQTVAWSAGSGTDLSMAMPDYEPGGYTSEPTNIAPEPVAVEQAKPVRRVARKKSVAKRNVVPVQRQEIASVRRAAPQQVYSPPLPTPETVSGQRRVIAPPPQPPVVPAVRSTPPLVTARSGSYPAPAPVAYTAPSPVPAVRLVDPGTTASTRAAVPLPY